MSAFVLVVIVVPGAAIDPGMARYGSPPAGDFRFLLQASDAGGPWIDSEVPPPLWAHPSSIAAVAFLVFAAILFLHVLRVRRIEQRHGAVLAERTRIAHEFHDTLAQGLTAAHLKIHSAMTAVPEDGTVRELLDSAQRLLRWSLGETRRADAGLRSETLERHSLVEAVDVIAEKMTTGLPFQVTVDLDGGPRRLDPAVERHLLRITQEALANALRHAKARQIDVAIEFDSRTATLSVSDDGGGSGPTRSKS